MKKLLFGDKYAPVSDIACERERAQVGTDGIEFKIESSEGFVWEKLRITNRTGSVSIGKPIGRYDTINTGEIHLRSESEEDEIKNEIAKELCSLTEDLDISPDKILVAGLGNERITADSVGPKCVSKINATRYLFRDSVDEDIPDCSEIACISPGVSQNSGIESFEIISGVASTIKPSLIIAVDSIATASSERLGKCIQLCDTGIVPGSGVGGRRMVLNATTVGVPVIAIGAPTVINSKLICTSNTDSDNTAQESKELFLSPREIDLITDAFASVIAGAINQAFGVF